jgi:hypothetical protein
MGRSLVIELEGFLPGTFKVEAADELGGQVFQVTEAIPETAGPDVRGV